MITEVAMWVGGVLAYVFVGGCFAAFPNPKEWNGNDLPTPLGAGALWPLILVCAVFYHPAAGPTMFRDWLKARREQRALPRAEVRRG